MYCGILFVKDVKHKVNEDGSQLWEAWCHDIRRSSKGKDYNAFTVTANFWGAAKPCEPEQYQMIEGDLVQQNWQDPVTQVWKSKNVISNARILNVVNGNDITPTEYSNEQEIPL